MRIGYIYASIAGDRRYGSKVEVTRHGRQVHVCLSESSPSGGRDSDTESVWRNTATDIVDAEPKLVLQAIKRIIANELGTTIKTYGKPTKKFNWYGIESKGLNIRLCAAAIEATNES